VPIIKIYDSAQLAVIGSVKSVGRISWADLPASLRSTLKVLQRGVVDQERVTDDE
jgi:hypothetical protein